MSLWLSKIIGPTARGLAVASVGLILGAAVLGVIEILVRWILRYSLVGMVEVSTVAIILGVCGCFPYCLLTRGNIAIRMFSHVRSVLLQKILEGFAGSLVFAVFLMMAYQMWLHGLQLSQAGGASLMLRIPMGLVWSVAAVLAFFGALIQLHVVICTLRGVPMESQAAASRQEG